MKKNFRGKNKAVNYLNMTEKEKFDKTTAQELCVKRKEIRKQLLIIKEYVRTHPGLIFVDEGQLAATEHASRILNLDEEVMEE